MKKAEKKHRRGAQEERKTEGTTTVGRKGKNKRGVNK